MKANEPKRRADNYNKKNFAEYMDLIYTKIRRRAENGFYDTFFQEEELHYTNVQSQLKRDGYTIQHDDNRNMYKVSTSFEPPVRKPINNYRTKGFKGCKGFNCPIKEDCHRHTTPASEYGDFRYNNGCPDYLPTEIGMDAGD